jgi:hypothetical protein
MTCVDCFNLRMLAFSLERSGVQKCYCNHQRGPITAWPYEYWEEHPLCRDADIDDEIATIQVRIKHHEGADPRQMEFVF